MSISPAAELHTPLPLARRRGAPKGNVNALKHGLYSRRLTAGLGSVDLPGLDRLAVARRLHEERRREINRVAVALARLAATSQYYHERDAAVAEGRPLPHPPLLPLRWSDLKIIKAFVNEHMKRFKDERRRSTGLLTADHPDLAHERDVAADYDQLVAFALTALHDSATPTPFPSALATHLNLPDSNPDQMPAPEPENPEQFTNANLHRTTAQIKSSPPSGESKAPDSSPATRVHPSPDFGRGAGGEGAP